VKSGPSEARPDGAEGKRKPLEVVVVDMVVEERIRMLCFVLGVQCGCIFVLNNHVLVFWFGVFLCTLRYLANPTLANKNRLIATYLPQLPSHADMVVHSHQNFQIKTFT